MTDSLRDGLGMRKISRNRKEQRPDKIGLSGSLTANKVRFKICIANNAGGEALYQFRDPIHGFIEVSELELRIIDSSPFQRLRNIKQLATTYLVYPGAEHTRFGHSLGVMHLVTRAFESALENYKTAYGRNLFDRVTTAWYRQILRLIALTHDLGHAPFSHASEALFDKNIEHEEYTRKIIQETEIAEYINDIGAEFCKEFGVGEEFAITPELLWLVYGEKNVEFNDRYRMPDFKFLRSFMDSELDCDKMDYLLRDSYYCGVNYGKYDLNRLLFSLNVYFREDHKIMQLAIEHGGAQAFEEFVIARYFMFIQVYFHKTRRYLDHLLVNNILLVLPDGQYPNNIREYLEWDDLAVLVKIKERRGMDDRAEQFLSRRVMTCVYETSLHGSHHKDYTLYNIVKRELKSKLKSCTIIEDTAHKLAHKIPVIEQYDAESGQGIPVLLPYTTEPSSITEESVLLQSLDKKAINIKRIYIEKQYAEQAKAIVNGLLAGGEETYDDAKE